MDTGSCMEHVPSSNQLVLNLSQGSLLFDAGCKPCRLAGPAPAAKPPPPNALRAGRTLDAGGASWNRSWPSWPLTCPEARVPVSGRRPGASAGHATHAVAACLAAAAHCVRANCARAPRAQPLGSLAPSLHPGPSPVSLPEAALPPLLLAAKRQALGCAA